MTTFFSFLELQGQPGSIFEPREVVWGRFLLPRGLLLGRFFLILGCVFAVLSRWLNVFNGISIILRTRVCDPKSSKTSVPWGLPHETVRKRFAKSTKKSSQTDLRFGTKNGYARATICYYTSTLALRRAKYQGKHRSKCFVDFYRSLPTSFEDLR